MNKQEKEYALEVWYDTRFDDARFEKARKISIEALEGKTGHWITGISWKCDQCNYEDSRALGTPFCPICGAMMVEPQESEGKKNDET